MLVLGTVAGASPQAQQLAAAAAVLGPHRPWPSATVAGLDDARAACDELTRAHVVHPVEGPEGTVLRFTHPVIRTAVYDDVGLATRAMLHTRAADVTSGARSLRHRVSARRDQIPSWFRLLSRRLLRIRHMDVWAKRQRRWCRPATSVDRRQIGISCCCRPSIFFCSRETWPA